MKQYAIYDLVGVQVSDSYPWLDTLFVTQGVAQEGEAAFALCRQKIFVEYEKKLRTDDARDIGDGAYIGQDLYVDSQYGVRIQRTAEGFLKLIAAQECNEWLIIAVQLALLAENHTLLHAAAVEKDGQVLLMPSWGGVGKTATVCRFVRDHGWRLLGDDLVILGEGRVLPFLKPFVIYPYHKELFPELFDSGENHTVKNLKLSSLMSKMLPGVKRALRPFPGLLAFLRKHNPQSMRVSPSRIFQPEQLSQGGRVKAMVWLERSMKDAVEYSDIPAQALASKAVSVSCVELFAAKLDAVYHLCGCGMLRYEDIFGRMQELVTAAAAGVDCALLEIPASVHITQVGELIYRKTQEDPVWQR